MAISSGILLPAVPENPTFPILSALAYTTGLGYRPTCDEMRYINLRFTYLLTSDVARYLSYGGALGLSPNHPLPSLFSLSLPSPSLLLEVGPLKSSLGVWGTLSSLWGSAVSSPSRISMGNLI